MDYIEKKREERRMWLVKYNAASEEEKKIMLEERKVHNRKEELARQKRIAEDRKNRFIANCERQIEVYTSLKDALEKAIPVIEKFNGKVLNRRLTKAISESLNGNIWLSLENEKVVFNRNHYYGGNIYDKVSVLLTTDNDFRIISSNCREKIQVLEDAIENNKCLIESYDSALESTMKLQNQLKEYSDTVKFELREYFKKEYVIYSL